MIQSLKKGAILGSLLLFAAGTAYAMPAEHENIVLYNSAGGIITDLDAVGNAFSMKETCGQCHNGSGEGVMAFSVEDIEKHSYHAQLAANEHKGWNSYNPDSADAWRRGAGPKGKNWVQGQGHVGAW